MIRNSLRLRLLLASVASIAVALLLAGLALVALFERHVERRVDAELETYIRQLAGNLDVGADAAPALSADPADPRFTQIFSGLYWQVQDHSGGPVLRSRSLWDYVIPLPADALEPGVIHAHELPGPEGSRLHVQERPVIYDTGAGRRVLRIAAAIDRRTLEQARAEFAAELAVALAVLGLVLVAAAWVQVTVGLRPLEAVRRGISEIRSRSRRRLDGRYPDEIMPLVAEVNELLDAQETAMERARHRAADLAHGLKTPLTVLAGDARKLRARGETEIADELGELAGAMRRHIDGELARARAAAESARGRSETDLAATVEGVVATLRRTPRGAALEWELALPERCPVALDANDLAEAVGNLLENASKWARRRVRIGASETDGAVALTVLDDGPGVPEEMIEALGARGVRLDQRIPGTGMGLAIVKEILEAYGGAVTLRNAAGGGLLATLSLPRGGTGAAAPSGTP